MNFIIQWFKGWSEFQKEDFVHVLAQRMKDAQVENDKGRETDADPSVNNLVNGIKGLETSGGRPPSLFLCQVKLFNEWWTSWTSDDRDKMGSLFKEADPSFYTAVESDMIGESRKLDEDFMTIPTTKSEEGGSEVINGAADTPIKPTAPVFNVTKVIINNGPSSFSSIDNENVSNGGAEKVNYDADAEVTVSINTNGDCDSAEPEATEI